jgi:hypothetical protein
MGAGDGENGSPVAHQHQIALRGVRVVPSTAGDSRSDHRGLGRRIGWAASIPAVVPWHRAGRCWRFHPDQVRGGPMLENKDSIRASTCRAFPLNRAAARISAARHASRVPPGNAPTPFAEAATGECRPEGTGRLETRSGSPTERVNADRWRAADRRLHRHSWHRAFPRGIPVGRSRRSGTTWRTG